MTTYVCYEFIFVLLNVPIIEITGKTRYAVLNFKGPAHKTQNQ